jgi:hypothetical protein
MPIFRSPPKLLFEKGVRDNMPTLYERPAGAISQAVDLGTNIVGHTAGFAPQSGQQEIEAIALDPNNPTNSRKCLFLNDPEILGAIQEGRYDTPINFSGTPAGFWVYTDAVRAGFKRLIFSADAAVNLTAGGMQPSLWRVPPGSLPSQAYNDPFFIDYWHQGNGYSGLPSRGTRVDGHYYVLGQGPYVGTAFVNLIEEGQRPVVLLPGDVLLFCSAGPQALGVTTYQWTRLIIKYADIPLATEIAF